jgi:ORF6N domain-containing protein
LPADFDCNLMAKRVSRTRKAVAPRPLVPLEIVERKIFIIGGQKAMLRPHLAELYAVEPRALMQAVKRNLTRFPEDFMFQLAAAEFADLKSQIVISVGAASDARGPMRSPNWASRCSPAC